MKITANENDVNDTFYRRLGNSCCHHRHFCKWTVVILLQVLMVSQEKRAVKNEKHEKLSR